MNAENATTDSGANGENSAEGSSSDSPAAEISEGGAEISGDADVVSEISSTHNTDSIHIAW